jgi:hypothetical protein
MIKKRKGLTVILFLLFVLSPNNLFAEEIESTQYIQSGSSAIETTTSGTVIVSGDTKAYSIVDEITVSLSVQYWDGGQWVDFSHVADFSKKEASYVDGNEEVIVSSGYYYRTKGIHTVYQDGTTETLTSYSNYVYVD